jgi:hypothetical protein
MFSGMAKTRKIARRLHGSIKIQCSGLSEMAPKSKKRLRKPVQKRMRKMMPKLTELGGQMEPKWSQKGIRKSMCFLARFLEASGNIDGASGERRRSVDGASTVTLSPADPPGRRHIIKEYCKIIIQNRHGYRI